MLGGYSPGAGAGEGVWHPLHFCLSLGFLERLFLFHPPSWQLFPVQYSWRMLEKRCLESHSSISDGGILNWKYVHERFFKGLFGGLI